MEYNNLVHRVLSSKGNVLIQGGVASGITTTLAAIAAEIKKRGEKVLIVEEEGYLAHFGDVFDIKVFPSAEWGLPQVLEIMLDRALGPIGISVPLTVIIDVSGISIYNKVAYEALVAVADRSTDADVKLILGWHSGDAYPAIPDAARRYISNIFSLRRIGEMFEWFDASGAGWNSNALPTITELLKMFENK